MTGKMWDEEILRRDGTLLQSWEWSKLQESLGRVVHLTSEPYALLVSMPLPFGMRYEYAPHGPAGTVINSEALHELSEHTHGERTIFLRIEPRVAESPQATGALMHAGFKKAADVQPSETMFLDLRRGEEDILRDMEHDTRYAIRVAKKRGVVVTTAEGDEKHSAFAKFWELFETTNVRHGLHAYSKRYYEAVAALEGSCRTELFLAEREGVTLAAAIVAYFGSVAYYLYAASRAGCGKYNAPSLLLWEVIRRAQIKGLNSLDLWGASAAKKEWRGVTAFKKSFGGTPRLFVGTWDYVYRPFWYFMYRLAVRFR
ncbi:MAG: peptidoglycan bridge formation glycyltransferase FemA/FemB family protein [Candidatus Jorgensenbacteria bacterium]|nr:peptidoglycan bridge formation glycyltransferase FemA/FemB family protein [Candidatus Jorgensenbacteria bacterium]